MADSSESAGELLEDLNNTNAEMRYHKVLQKLTETNKQNEAQESTINDLRNEINKYKSEIEKLRRDNGNLQSDLDQEKSNLARINQATTIKEEHYLASKVTIDLIQTELNEVKSKNKQLNYESKKDKAAVLKLEFDNKSISHDLQMEKVQRERLSNRLKELTTYIEKMTKDQSARLHDKDAEIRSLSKSLNEAKARIEVLQDEISASEQAKKQISSEHQTVSLEKENYKQQYLSLYAKYDELHKQETDANQRSLNRINKLEMELKSAKAKANELQNKLTLTQKDLTKETEIKERYFKNFISSNNTAAPEALDELIQRFADTKKDPSNIFTEYFRLQTIYDQLLEESRKNIDQIEKTNREMISKNREIGVLMTTVDTQKKKIDSLELANNNIFSECTKLEIKYEETSKLLTEAKSARDDIEKALNDLKYQFKVILYHIEKRGEPIPLPQNEGFQMLLNTNIVPTIPHNDLIMKNVNEAVEKNVHLAYQLRKAQEALQKHEADGQQTQKALTESTQVIKELKQDLTKVKAENSSYLEKINSLKSMQTATSDLDAISKTHLNYEASNNILFEEFSQDVIKNAEKTAKELNNLHKQLREAQVEISQASSRERSLRLDIENLKRNDDRQKEETAKANRKVEEGLEAIANLRKEVEANQQLVNDANKELLECKFKLDCTLEKLEFAKQSKRDLEILLENKSKEYDNLMLLFNRLSEAVEKGGTLSSGGYLERIDSLSARLEEKANLLAQKEAQIKQLQAATSNNHSPEFSDVLTQLNAIRDQLTETQDRISKVATEQSAVEARLSNYGANDGSNSDIPQDATYSESYTRLIEEYKEKVKEMSEANFAYHQEVDKLKNTIENLMAKSTTEAGDTEAFYKELQKRLESEIERSKVLQTLTENSATLYKASMENYNEKMNKLDSEIAALNNTISNLQKELSEANEEITELKQKIQQQVDIIESKEKALEDENEKSHALEQKLTESNKELLKLRNELDASTSQLNIANQNKSTLQARYDSALEYQRVQKEEFEERIKKSDEEVSQLFEKFEKLIAQVSTNNPEIVVEATEEAIAEYRRANDSLRGQKDLAERNYMKEKDKSKVAEDMSGLYQGQVATLKALNASLIAERESLIEKANSSATEDKSFAEALKLQNRDLLIENEKLKASNTEWLKNKAELENTIQRLSILEASIASKNEKIELLEADNADWNRRVGALKAKYQNIDPEEFEKLKSDLEKNKKEYEAIVSEKTKADEQLTSLQAEKSKLEEEKTGLVKKCNERARHVLELRKKLDEANKKEEADPAVAEKLTAVTKEKEELDASKLKLEKELKEKDSQYEALNKKFTSMLQRARTIQLENKQMKQKMEEMKTTAGNPEKTAELEKELTDLKKQLTDNNLDITRARAQASMAQHKYNKLLRETEALKAKLAENPHGTESSEPTDSSKPSGSTLPTEPVKTVEAAKATEIAKATDSAKPIDTDEPAKNEEPTKDDEPAKTKEPTKDDEPAKTEESTKNDEPAKVDEPAKIEEPATTEKSATAGEAVDTVQTTAEGSGLTESSALVEDTQPEVGKRKRVPEGEDDSVSSPPLKK